MGKLYDTWKQQQATQPTATPAQSGGSLYQMWQDTKPVSPQVPPQPQPREQGLAERIARFGFKGLETVGGLVQKGGEAFVKTPLQAGTTAGAGLYTLGQVARASLSGKEKGKEILSTTARRLEELQQMPIAPPEQGFAGGARVGLELGAQVISGGLATRAAAAGMPPAYTGAVTGGAAGLGYGLGTGLEKAAEEKGGILKKTEALIAPTAETAAGGVLLGWLTGALSEKLTKFDSERIANQQKKVIGEITQLKNKQKLSTVARGIQTFDKDDLADIKTYDEFNILQKNKIATLAGEQDKLLDAVPGRQSLDSFNKTFGADKTIISNPVKDSLKQLDELYTNTKNYKALVAIKELNTLAQTNGLTATEVNQLARQYNIESKAFSAKTGERLTSINSVAYENTRKALKEAARNLLPDDTSKEIDDAMSTLYSLNRATVNVEERVQNITNKIQERGMLQKIGRALGIAADKLVGGFGKAFVSSALFPSNIGQKQMNYLEIEKALNSNLRTVASISNLSDNKLIDALLKAFNSLPIQTRNTILKTIIAPTGEVFKRFNR